MAAARMGLTVVRGLGDPERARTVVEPRWEALQGRRDADPTLLALAEAMVTCYLWQSLDPSRLIEERMRLARRLGDDAALADSLNALALHYQDLGLPPVARILLQAAADLARTARRTNVLARALVNLTGAVAEESYDLAMAPAEEALATATQLGDDLMLSHARLGLAVMQIHRGLWSDVEVLLNQDYRDPVTLIGSSLLRWIVSEARGQAWDRPWQPGDAQFETLTSVEWRKEAALALMLRVDGDLPAAIDVALEGLDRSLAATGLGESFEMLWRLASDMVLEGNSTEGHDRLVAMVTTDDVVPLAVQGHHARFSALWAMSQDGVDPASVDNGLHAAMDLYRRIGSRLLEARTAGDLGTWLVRCGRADEAEPLLHSARSLFEEIGAVAWLAQLEDSLVTVG